MQGEGSVMPPRYVAGVGPPSVLVPQPDQWLLRSCGSRTFLRLAHDGYERVGTYDADRVPSVIPTDPAADVAPMRDRRPRETIGA
jgi:hypothetical protein